MIGGDSFDSRIPQEMICPGGLPAVRESRSSTHLYRVFPFDEESPLGCDHATAIDCKIIFTFYLVHDEASHEPLWMDSAAS